MRRSRAPRPRAALPEHLHPVVLRRTYLDGETGLNRLLCGESPAVLRAALVALLDTEKVDRDGDGRIPRPDGSALAGQPAERSAP